MISSQHFQQQAAYAAWAVESVAQMGLNHPWGVIESALPPVLLLNDDVQEAIVVLALPMLRANGGNCLKPEDLGDRPVRYRQRWHDVRNLFGEDTRQIAVMQPELTLRFAHQNNSDYLICPLPRLQQDSQGVWALDDTFIPPILTVQHPPSEELLRLPGETHLEKGATQVHKQQSELRLRQLLARYALQTEGDESVVKKLNETY